MSGSVSSLEGELNYIVKEYLEYIELSIVVELFENECQRLGHPVQQNERGSRKDERLLKIQGSMFSSFDDGDRAAFFSAWEEHISESVREEDAFCQKLEFQLHLHFAVAPLRIDNSSDATVAVPEGSSESMSYFRYYLETKGSILSHVPEVLPYFALPYIPDPQGHPSFQDLFKDSWVSNLRRKLETFLWEALKDSANAAYQPRLVELFQCSDMVLEDARSDLKVSAQKLDESVTRNNLQGKQLFRLQDDYQRLMLVSAQLISVIEAAVQGDLEEIDNMLSVASQHFPELFQTDRRRDKRCGGQDNCPSSRDLSLTQHMKESLHRQSLELLEPVFVSLDYCKVKRDLVILEPRAKATLLQALRWRLTKSYTEEQQEIVLASYISTDLLGCEKLSHYRKQMVNMLKTSNKGLLQSFARLFNVFASFRKGRTYLSMYPEYLSILQDYIIKNRNIDIITRNMILGVLQKLSLRHMLQLRMIEGNIIMWLIDNLEKVDDLDDYYLEYSAALLMNLCLNATGREKCKEIIERVLQVLMILLKSNKAEVLPYVNGGLYSLISDVEVRQHARNMGLQELMESMKKLFPENTHQQIDFVLKKLASDAPEEKCEENVIDEEDEDEIEVEPEVDLHDLIFDNVSPVGEKLLKERYADASAQNPRARGTGSPSNRHLNRIMRSTNSMERGYTKLDSDATEMVRRLTGEPSKTVVQAECAIAVSPTALKMEGLNVQEYTLAFSSRPKIPRSPEPEDEDLEDNSGGEES